jgi:hypothetical protein
MAENATRVRRKKSEKPIKKPKYIKTSKESVVIKPRGSFKCKFCERTFSNENTVTMHMCEQRRRFNQKDATFSRLGFEAFISIQHTYFGNDKKNDEEDFRKSNFYLACLKWGHFVIDIKCLNPKQYLSWLLKLNVSIDQWNKDEIYDCFLQHYVFIEDNWDAFQRSFQKIISWGEEVNKPYNKYFVEAGTARILTDVRKAWVSGWVIYCSESGRGWLESLNKGDLELVWAWVDPSRWQIQLEKYPMEVTQFTKICKDAEL